MTQTEQLRCNICGITVTSDEAKGHSSTSSHSSLKQRLEQELASKRKSNYASDSSVVVQWRNSV